MVHIALMVKLLIGAMVIVQKKPTEINVILLILMELQRAIIQDILKNVV